MVSGDFSLIEKALHGDRESFDVLMNRYCAMVYMIAFARLGDCEAAQDLTQEVFLRVYLNLNRYNPHHKFSTWLCRITQNLACDWLRHRQVRSRVISMVPLEERWGDMPDEHAHNGWDKLVEDDRRRALQDAVLRLPVEQREIVLLRYVEELNNKEIAERLGTHPSTIGRQLKKALKVLKRDLTSLPEEAATLLAMPRELRARTGMVIAAVAVMTPAAKASLDIAIGGLGSVAVVSAAASHGGLMSLVGGGGSFLSSLGSALLQPLIWIGNLLSQGFGLLKMLALPLLLLAGAGGAIYYFQSGDDSTNAGKPTPTTVAPAGPAGSRASAPTVNRQAMLAKVAKTVGAELTGYKQVPGGAEISIAWSSDRGDILGGFLDQARLDGAIRDFDLNTAMGSQIVNDRSVRTGFIRVYF